MANDTASIDWTKPILWDGEPARVLATDMEDGWPVAVRTGDGRMFRCDIQGGNSFTTNRVTNAAERVERWANVYGPSNNFGHVCWHTTRNKADQHAGMHRRDCIKGTFENDKLVNVAIVPLEEK